MFDTEIIRQLQRKLASFPIFEGTQGFQLEQVIRASMLVSYPTGIVIFEPNDLSTGFFIILSGIVRIQIHELKALDLGPGRYFGEYSLIENRPHRGRAVTLSDTEVLVIPSDVFNNLLQQSLPFSNNLLKTLVKRLKSKERLEYALIEKNLQINEQNEQITAQNEKIKDSIEYAGIIQKALLPQEKLLKLKFESCFIIFQPCENVSGDFYWFAQRYNEYCIVVADCTGHGVPAGLISIMGVTYLNEIVNLMQDPDPGKILNLLGDKIQHAFSSNEERFQAHQGMDLSMVTINFETMTLRYAGANLPVFLVRNGDVFELQPEKSALGGYYKKPVFKSQQQSLQNDDMVYLFTDGFVDQMGGSEGKRFGFTRFKDLISNAAELNVYKQQRIMLSQFFDWKGDFPQIDDITMIGIQI